MSKLHVDQMTKYFGTAAAPQSLLNKNLQKNEGLAPIPVTYPLTTVGGEMKEYDAQLYCIILVDRSGSYHLIKGYGINEISSEIKSLILMLKD